MRFVRVALLAMTVVISGCALIPTGNLYAMRNEAQLAYADEEDGRAEKLLIGLSRAVPNEPENWFYLGNLYARTNRPEKAAEAYQKALMLKSTDARVWHNLGVIRLREAWAAFIQGHNLVQTDEALQAKLESLIEAMEKMPLEGLQRKGGATAGSADTSK